MPMRVDCKNYESRTYANGEVVRKCRIDLAPEAPWRCPDDCPGYERRLADAAWQHGSLVDPEPGFSVPKTHRSVPTIRKRKSSDSTLYRTVS